MTTTTMATTTTSTTSSFVALGYPAAVPAEDLTSVHKSCFKNRAQLEQSDACGCFYCLATYAPAEVTEWVTEDDGQQTALCPRCGIDSVVGSVSGCPVGDRTFLERMQRRYF
jgi:hypothetical protein